MRKHSLLFCLPLIVIALRSSHAQVTPDTIRGESPYAVYQVGNFDNVNLTNGNLYLKIPLLAFPQRGKYLDLTFTIFYNDKQWYIGNLGQWNANSSTCNCYSTGQWTWNYNQSAPPPNNIGVYVARNQHLDMGYDEQVTQSLGGGANNEMYTVTTDSYGHFVAGPDGSKHYVGDAQYQYCTQSGGGICPTTYSSYSNWYPSLDATNYSVVSGTQYGGPTEVVDGHGVHYTATTVMDPAGNTITASGTGWTDSIGRPIPGTTSGPGTPDGVNTLAATSGVVNGRDPIPGVPMSGSFGTCPSGTTAARDWAVPSFGGGTEHYYLCYTNLSYQTDFHQDMSSTVASEYANVAEGSSSAYGQPALVLTAIMLPNSTSYTFSYDQYLSLTTLILPTGGSIQYTWINKQLLSNTAQGPQQTIPIARVLRRKVVTPGGGQPQQVWNYYYIPSTSGSDWTVVTDPAGNDTEHQVSYGNGTDSEDDYYAGCGPHHPTSDPNDSGSTCAGGSGTPLKTVSYTLTAYAGAIADGGSLPYTGLQAYEPTSTTTTLAGPNGGAVTKRVDSMTPSYGPCTIWVYLGPSSTPQQPQQQTYPNCYYTNQVQSSAYYDYGSGSPGALLKTDTTNYEWQASNGTPYLNADLISLVGSEVTTDGSGAKVAETDYGYDENNGSPQGAYGNQTSVTKWNNGGSSDNGGNSPATQTIYNSQGMATLLTDANGTQTSISAYQCSGAFPQTVVKPYQSSTTTAETTSYAYDCNTGKVTSITDPNNQQTSFDYSDPLNRLKSITDPDVYPGTSTHGVTSYQYNDTASPVNVTVSETINPSATKTTEYDVDGLGRLIHSKITSDPVAAIVTDTNYDAVGHLESVSNPYRTTSDPSYGTTSYSYDPLDRKTGQTNPDTTTEGWSYSGNSVTYTDESGNQWQRTSDALGRLTKVLEPNGSTQSANMETDYSYDANGNLKSVSQIGDGSGNRNRSFFYDSLSRLLASSNPERTSAAAPASLSCPGVAGSWGTCYTYDATGNLISKTDNRNVKISYSYDALDRLTWKHYNDGVTETVGFGYDGKDENGNAISGLSNVLGRLSRSSNEINAASTYSYDPMGRVAQKSSCIPGDCTGDIQVNATYDLAGNIITLTNGSPQQPVQISYNYDGVNRLSSITSNWAPDCNHPSALFSATEYGPVGLTSATLGALNSGCPTSSTNAITETRSYNIRTWIASESNNASALAVSAPTGTITIPGSDSEQSALVNQRSGTGYFTISGSEQSTTIYVPCGPYGQTCPQTIWDSGPISVTVNGTVYNGGNGYGEFSTASGLASNIASEIDTGPDTNANAVDNGNNTATIYLTARATGVATDYAISGYSATGNSSFFSGPSFTVSPSGSTLTGGSDGTPVYDTGTITATINNVQASASWVQGDTPDTVASKLAASIGGAMSGFLTASSHGSNVITVQSNSSSYWPISVSWNDTNTQYFSSPSFTANSVDMNPNTAAGPAYNYSVTYDGIGNIRSVNDSVIGNWSFQTPGYDTLNRLLNGNSTSGPYAGNYMCWAYDGFGNRTAEAIQSSACSSPVSATARYNTNNQVTWTSVNGAVNGFTYDGAGDVIYDGANQYLYDAEGRICAVSVSVAGVTTLTGYVYDAEGHRVAKGTLGSFSCNLSTDGFSATNSYVVGLYGEQLTETNGGTGWLHTNVFADGQLLATYGGSDTYFALNDWLGTKRAEAGAGGCLSTYSSLQFGNRLESSGGCPDATEHHFTGREHDQESGNDFMLARYYSSNAGRFLSPDWSARAEPVPYAKLDDPQTLNLYQYMRNNPLGGVDPDGHCCEADFLPITTESAIAGTEMMASNPYVQGGLLLAAAAYAGPEVLAAAEEATTVTKGLGVGAAALGVTGTAVNGTTMIIGTATHTDPDAIHTSTDMVTNLTNPVAAPVGLVTGSAKKGSDAADLATVLQAGVDVARGKGVSNPAEVVSSLGGARDAVKSAFQATSSSVSGATAPTPLRPPAPAPPPPPPCSVAGACSN